VCRNQDRTLAKINIQHTADVARNDGIVAQQIGDGAIAVAGVTFGSKNRLVNTEFAAGKPA
jgi:hypothetical protein